MFRKLQLRYFEKGSFYMILSSIFTTIFGFFAKMSSGVIYLPLMIFLRFLIPFLIVIPYFIKRREGLKEIAYRKTGKHFLRAVAVIISQYALFHYFTRASLTDGVLLWNTAPLFMPLIVFVFYRYRISRVVWFSILISFLGVICVLKPSTEVFDLFSFYGFLSGFAMACSQVLYGVNRENETLDQNLFLFFLYSTFTAGVVFSLSLLDKSLSDVLRESFSEKGAIFPLLGVLGVGIGTVGNQALRGMAFKYAKPASLGPLIYLSVVFSAMIDFFMHPAEVGGFIFVVGILLVFMGTMIRIVQTSKA